MRRLVAGLEAPERWPKWGPDIRKIIIEHQIAAPTCAYGSWNPEDCWSKTGGRVYSTAIMLLVVRQTYRSPWR